MFPSLVEEIKFRHNIARQWVQMSAADAGVLSTVLLTACRNLALHQNSIKLSTVALQYKVLTISSLNEALSREGELISDNTIIKTLALASESVSCLNTLCSQYIGLDLTWCNLESYRRSCCYETALGSYGQNGRIERRVWWRYEGARGFVGFLVPKRTPNGSQCRFTSSLMGHSCNP